MNSTKLLDAVAMAGCYVVHKNYLGAPDVLAEVVAPREGARVHARGVDERGGDADEHKHGEGDEGDERGAGRRKDVLAAGEADLNPSSSPLCRVRLCSLHRRGAGKRACGRERGERPAHALASVS